VRLALGLGFGVGFGSFLTACFLAVLAPGCASERSSPECKDVCRKQARCVDKASEAAAAAAASTGSSGGDQTKFDQSECIAACTSLQRDSEGAKLVEQHRACYAGAGDDCTALLACP